ncbi:cytidine deaminase [Massilicoli timonensis]|uniref:cytidine deaminase family protein n=1 Tax=Massilicoli timonensis TaxID=2015901 RepID=UPI0023F400E3|nr:cytidine deaminase [Massilicoli timonensis]
MKSIWNTLYDEACRIQNDRTLSAYIEAGGTACALLSAKGNIYTGVCIDACCSLGICAERNAIFQMITNGEQEIQKILTLMPDGSCAMPCGACRELMVQLMPHTYQNIEIMADIKNQKTVSLEELTPHWWITSH